MNFQDYFHIHQSFLLKIKHSKNIPNNALLVTADVVGLYPSITREALLRALKEVLDKREEKKISAEDLIKMAEFALKK